jgi:hypothetical protein
MNGTAGIQPRAIVLAQENASVTSNHRDVDGCHGC